MATSLTIANLASESSAGTAATGGISFSDQPSAGDRITVYSIYNQYDFWFASTASLPNEVTIGSAVANTNNNTIYAVRNRKSLEMNATAYSSGMTLEYDKPGTIFNVDIEKSGTNINVVGMSGGTDGYDNTDRRKSAPRYVAIVYKTGDSFDWGYTGYLGRFKFTNGLSLNVIEDVLDWQDINRLRIIMGAKDTINAYQLTEHEYHDSVANVRSAIESA